MPRRAAVIVAHPDDESLWFGGLILRLGLDHDVEVVCMSYPKRDPERMAKLSRACATLGARLHALGYALDIGPDKPLIYDPDALARLRGRYELIATHNRDGEYGHAHHKQVAKAVAQTLGGWGSTIVESGYGRRGSAANLWADIQLSAGEMDRKRAAILAYDHKAPDDGGRTKGQALIERYAPRFDLAHETYFVVDERKGKTHGTGLSDAGTDGGEASRDRAD